MSKLVTIFGGSGFVGRYIAQRMARDGWRVRVAVRRPNEALFVRAYGVVGQVEPMLCNIRDDDSVRLALTGADAAVNCVGILNETGRNRFEAVHADGAGRVARIAAEAGVEHLVHISAIGADVDSKSEYLRTKALGEAAVQAAFPGASILRPSLVFGPEDQSYNRLARMAVISPAIVLVGGNTRFQPVYVKDVAEAAAKCAEGSGGPGVFELGGPETKTFREIAHDVLEVIRRRRLVINLPFWMGMIVGWGLDMVQSVSLGLIVNRVLTRDQVRALRHDNVVSATARTFSDLGIVASGPEAVLPTYLWRFRPSGQYAAIKESAKILKN